MLSSIARSVRLSSKKFLTVAKPSTTAASVFNFRNPCTQETTATFSRCFSSTDPSVFQPTPPTAISRDVAEGIQDNTLFYLRHGVSSQRLKALADDTESPLTLKWQRMMEIYLSTQVYVISGLGYSGDESGLQQYTQQLATFMTDVCDDEERETYRQVGNETWRELLATAFDLDLDNMMSVDIATAREMMHKVSSKMQEPSILMKIQKECGKLPESKLLLCVFCFLLLQRWFIECFSCFISNTPYLVQHNT